MPSPKVIEFTVTVFPVATFLSENVADELAVVKVSDPTNPEYVKVIFAAASPL